MTNRERAEPAIDVIYPTILREPMADQHQLNSIIATALCDARKDHPDHRIDPEEAKQIAKCIVEALIDAGLQIVPVGKS
jgi:hypothetical protein